MDSGPTECYENIPKGSVWTSLVIYFFLTHFRSARNVFNLKKLMMIRVNWPNTCNGDLSPVEHLTASLCPSVAQTGNRPKVIALGCILLSWLLRKGHSFPQQRVGSSSSTSSCLCPPVPAGAVGCEVAGTMDLVLVTCALMPFAGRLATAAAGRLWGSERHIPP